MFMIMTSLSFVACSYFLFFSMFFFIFFVGLVGVESSPSSIPWVDCSLRVGVFVLLGWLFLARIIEKQATEPSRMANGRALTGAPHPVYL